VELIFPAAGPPQRGEVVDRSSGGLRVVAPVEVPVGTPLKVRAYNAPHGTPWAEVVVRWHGEFGGRHHLGCAFAEAPSWTVLLLFG
jgi:hypothetical protein